MDSDEKELIFINEWQYDVLIIKGVEVYFSQEKSNIKMPLEDIDAVLEKIPKNHREFIPRIYVVNYFCQENPETKGKHLAKSSYVILYPNAAQELQMVLTHEVGHVIWDKKLTPLERVNLKKEPPTAGHRPAGCSLRSGRFLWSASAFPRTGWRAVLYATGQRPGGKHCAF